MAARSMKCLAVWLGLVLLCATPALATVVELPVTALAGTYSCAEYPWTGCFQTVVIHLPVIPAAIHSVSLRMHGTTTPASFSCDGGPVHPGGVRFEAELYEPGLSGNYFLAESIYEAAGEVALTQPFAPGPFTNSTWGFLLDGTALLNFYVDGSNGIPECFVAGPQDSTTLADVTLLVDGEFPTATRGTSWGRLKVLYR